MKKQLAYAFLCAILLVLSTPAAFGTSHMGSLPTTAAVELLCKTGTGPQAQSTLISAQACLVSDGSSTGAFCLNPMADYTRGQVGKQGIPCALAQAFVDYKIALYCSFGIGHAVTGLDGPWIFPVGYGRRDAQSLVLPNGNIQHQWNVLCASIFTNGAER